MPSQASMPTIRWKTETEVKGNGYESDEQRIRGALQAIGEGDQCEGDAVIDQCHNDRYARSYWLRRAGELPALSRPHW